MYIDPTLGHIIEKAVKDEKGDINAYVLDNGDVIPKEQAVILARQGAIRGVSDTIVKEGDEFIRSLQEFNEDGILENLPTAEETVLD